MKLSIFVLRTALLAALLAMSVVAPAQEPAPKKQKADAKPKPRPRFADFKYGPHERNVLDFWPAKSARPTPLVVYIHGGGFRQGSKESLSPSLLETLLAQGISVVAINYRLSPEVSFPSHYLDSARAIQTARTHAIDWNIDPARIGATGSSAGAGTSLWIGFHDDMAEAKSADPVLRQSTRLTCLAVTGAQSSYDPRVIKEWVGEAASKHPALEGFFGVKAGEADLPAARQCYEAASAINYLTRDDPPVYAYYTERRGPLPADAKPGQGIHHINFGLRLKEKMDALGLECTVRHRDEGVEAEKETVAFFVQHLKPEHRANDAVKSTSR